jgi:DNA-binding MarR family transcriptional regulator
MANAKKAADNSQERIFKGLANHRRLQILRILQNRGPVSLDKVAEICGIQAPTACEHARKLRLAGLVFRRRLRRCIHLELTGRGELALQWAPRLESATARPLKTGQESKQPKGQ